MRATVISKPRKELLFPKMMISEENNTIVLFHKYGRGTVVNPGSSNWGFGEYVDCWVMSKFKDFHGTVTLENTQ